jgi:hypothetical protein
MVRGRSVNPSYRHVADAFQQGSTFREEVATVGALDADAIAFADSRFVDRIGWSWRVNTSQYGDVRTFIGKIRTTGRIRSGSYVETPTVLPKGSLLGRIRVSSRIRTRA